MPLGLVIGNESLRPHLVVAMDAEHGDAQLVQLFLSMPVAVLVAVIVHPHITQQDNSVIAAQAEPGDSFCNTMYFTVNISSN